MAHAYERAIADTHNDYVEQTSSGQTPGPSAVDTLVQQANMASSPKADVSSSSDNGASTESDSDSDASMRSAGGVIPGVPFSQAQLDSDSGSDSEYMQMSE
ncbi:hypothetical protein ACF07L_33780 [Streptomyces anulatus]|uniref:hypothetical protein n=1 Tax=Streptomyces anulatus TaxID=1892 RepID=UPI0036F9FEFF